MKRIKVFILILVLFLSFRTGVFAEDVVINEFLPAPSSGNQEWVEFYNATSDLIDLSIYHFDDDTNFDSDSGSSSKIALSGLLPSLQACYLDLSSYLNNSGDSPSLFKSGTIVDKYSYNSAQTDLSFARVPDGGNWQSNQTSSKSSNNCSDLAPTPTSSPTLAPTSTPASTSTPSPTHSPSPTKTPTPKSPTPTKSPTPAKNSPTSTKTSTPISSSSLSVSEKDISKVPAVEHSLSPINKLTSAPNPTTTAVLGSTTSNNLPKVLIAIGSVFLIACGILTFRKLKTKNEEGNSD